jgi:hypothetical protein
MIDMRSLFYELESMGFYEYVLPFMLVFVVVFAILEKTKIFGKVGDGDNPAAKTNINVVVSLIIGFLILSEPAIIIWMNAYLSRMAFFIVLGIMMMLVVSMFGGDSDFGSGGGAILGIIITLIALFWSLSSGTYGLSTPHWFYYLESYLSTLLVVGVFAGFIWLVAYASKDDAKKARTRRDSGD